MRSPRAGCRCREEVRRKLVAAELKGRITRQQYAMARKNGELRLISAESSRAIDSLGKARANFRSGQLPARSVLTFQQRVGVRYVGDLHIRAVVLDLLAGVERGHT